MPTPQAQTPSQRPSEYQRNAFAPAILAAIVCLAGIALIDHEYYFEVRYIITILAVIIGWFALQARQWWWVPAMLAIAVLWNPLYLFEFEGPQWAGAHVTVAGVFLAAGILIKTPRKPVAGRSGA